MKLKVVCIVIAFITFVLAACQSEDELEFDHYYSSGMVVYQAKCQNCHGEKGEGLVALMPPFTDVAYLKKNKSALACIVKYGLNNKPIKVASTLYDDNMPANQDMPAVAIAEVLTYITNSFGNKMGVISTQMVNSDLEKCK